MKAIRIVLSHDWPLLRKGVRAVLENRDDCDVVGDTLSWNAPGVVELIVE